MKTSSLLIGLAAGLLSCSTLLAQVPQLINYQGRVAVGGTNFNGTGQFKFALVNSNGVPTFWSNNGTSVNGSEPTAAVSLTVVNGLYSVLLGDATLPNMTVVPATVFTNLDVRLRIWFNGGAGSQLLTPDQRIAAVGYAMMSANVPDGLITSNKLAAGAVTAAKLADGSVTAAKLAPGAVTSESLGDTVSLGNSSNTVGRLDIYRTASNTPSITLFGSSSQISTYGSDGLEQARIYGSSWGELLLFNSLPGNAIAVDLSANGASGGYLNLRNTNGANRAVLSGANSGGSLTLYQSDSSTGASLTSSGTLSLYNTNASIRASLSGTSSGGSLTLYQADGSTGAFLDGDNSGYGLFSLRNTNGLTRVQMWGGPASGSGAFYNKQGNIGVYLYNYADNAGVVSCRSSNGNERAYLWGENNNGGGELALRNSANATTVLLQGADGNGDGRVITQVLQITGGSDLSEQFNISALHDSLKPGMIVCIDPEKPGQLITSSKAYDKTVAGIVSGAGGVNPGLLMGQSGSVADGKHPVALSGRVYCMMDASKGAIRPGDLITTSDTPGHGMKVKDSHKAQGAIIGKSMSSLEKGQGLVLVLVTLQ